MPALETEGLGFGTRKPGSSRVSTGMLLVGEPWANYSHISEALIHKLTQENLFQTLKFCLMPDAV